MKIKALLLVAVLGALLPLLNGCQPGTPGTLIPNQAPESRIVVAPMPNANQDHYLSPEVMFRVQWFGFDPDGQIVGYWLKVDADSVWTTRGDSAISFKAFETDPNHPVKTVPLPHSISVAAVDDAGAMDPSPATRSFQATNSIPAITEFVSEFLNGSLVGAGISFSITYNDSNPSGIFTRLWIDNQPVTDWDSRTKFQFCAMSDPTILSAIDLGLTTPVSISLLPAGNHTLTLRVMDWGGAVSDSVARTITVVDTVKPALESITSTYSGLDYYPDGSVFYADEAPTIFSLAGSAASYYGDVEAFRYRLVGQNDSMAWSSWGASSFDTLGLPAGAYRFEAQCRDWAGVVSDVSSYSMQIVEPTFSGSASIKVAVIDETRDGNSRPGSPSDAQCDSTWRVILGYDTTSWVTSQGWIVSELDYTTHKINDISYISPLNLFDKSVVIWHADDKAELNLKTAVQNKRLLSEYLDRGGRLFLCGWDVGENFGADTDSLAFSANSFAGKYLRILGGKRSNDKSFAGTIAVGGYPALNNDPAKMPPAWNAKLEKCWIFYPAHRTETIAAWNGVPFDSMGCAMKNFSPLNRWRTITCGFPIYFLADSGSQPFVRKAIAELVAP